jgi:pimeloyl-ACP methyl ester carboxylesterase
LNIVERFARNLVVLLLGTAAALALSAPRASAQIDFKPCPGEMRLACGHLSVPIDPADPSSGATIRLAIRRRRAPVGEGRTAVIALAGGPGQAAIPFTSTFEDVLGPILSTRDLIVFDQRGTGRSHPLRCRALEHPLGGGIGSAVRRCANQLGADRGFYTSADSAADIEAIRIAGGYERLILYGTSYGTRVALDYAKEHPSHVQALILDSVVAPNGPETLDLPTFAAIPRVLRQLCEFDGCRGITSKPVADLQRLVARIGAGSLGARVVGPSGQARPIRVTSENLLEVLIAGDLNPILRAEYPAAIRSALLGDTAALGRLIARTQSKGEAAEGIDVPLYFATTCEEQLFPWSRASSPGIRLGEARAKIDSLRSSAIRPFARRNVLAASDIRECAGWPFSTPAPAVDPDPLPDVPTIILSGADDLRTPTSGARALAARIPDAHLVVVPNTGHSVLTTEPGRCAIRAVRAMFAKTPIRLCRQKRAPSFLRPTPIAPRSLRAVPAVGGYHGTPGRTLTAIGLTLADVVRQLVLAILEGAPAGSSLRIGGLRRGSAQLSAAGLELHRYAYVPGVTLSGTLGRNRGRLVVGGSAAAPGELRLSHSTTLVGRLGGTDVRLPPRQTRGRTAGAARFIGAETSQAPPHAAEAVAGALAALARIRPSAVVALRDALRYAAFHRGSARATAAVREAE